MHGVLITHPRELHKNNGTGPLTQALCPNIELEVWQRKKPVKSIVRAMLEGRNVVLVYPKPENREFVENGGDGMFKAADAEKLFFVLLDGTWQQADKIYRQSPELQALKSITITPRDRSRFQLRRNQKDTGLSTVETAAEIFQMLGFSQDSSSILSYLQLYQARFEAQRSGHYLAR